ncbi:D-ribose pyranase [Pontibacillus yanchengensis]|uniref:D-ribose pyranase n=2 Tax=Pontibacillus yanchengensis TaxID=462910 RepID=A0ACC7VKZ1_9BACI|nr:D-ribose pyranase [Pontibacillus yanchengensis]MYL35261.1 D-ribose pyranase [Pontibacillus yanchengensis]MYL54871.1 D-ribose pyranase [Pontibacillus yanchengensis]
MKKNGMINSDIASVLARLGHTDTIVIADCGLPIPEHVPRIDLSITKGTPSFIEVLEAILDDMEVEKMTLANEMEIHNPSLHQNLLNRCNQYTMDFLSHDVLKEATNDAKVVIRTGEASPFANVILTSGVIF